MTDDSTVNGELDEDSDKDTPDDEQAATTGNTQTAQQPSVDWEARYKEAQSWGTRTTQLLRQREEELLTERQTRGQPQADPSDPLAPERAALAAERQRLQTEREWAAIRAEYPPEIVDAYAEASRNWQLDPSPRGAITGFQQGLAAFAARVSAASNGEPEPLPTRDQAVRPRVDTSRSDAPDPDAIKTRIAGAKERKDLGEHVRALLQFPEGRRTRS